MSTPNQGLPKSGKQNRRYFPLPKGMAEFSDEQIDAWVEKMYDHIAWNLNFGDQMLIEDL